MNSIVFDTHAHVKKLIAVGFTEAQAEVQTQVVTELINEQLVTKKDMKELEVKLKELETVLKRDMKELETGLKRDLKEIETGLRHEIKEMETGLRHEMKEMELRLRHDLTLRLGGMLTAGIAIVAALVKLF